MDQPDQPFLLADLWLIHDVRSAKLDQLFHIVLDQLSSADFGCFSQEYLTSLLDVFLYLYNDSNNKQIWSWKKLHSVRLEVIFNRNMGTGTRSLVTWQANALNRHSKPPKKIHDCNRVSARPNKRGQNSRQANCGIFWLATVCCVYYVKVTPNYTLGKKVITINWHEVCWIQDFVFFSPFLGNQGTLASDSASRHFSAHILPTPHRSARTFAPDFTTWTPAFYPMTVNRHCQLPYYRSPDRATTSTTNNIFSQ